MGVVAIVEYVDALWPLIVASVKVVEGNPVSSPFRNLIAFLLVLYQVMLPYNQTSYGFLLFCCDSLKTWAMQQEEYSADLLAHTFECRHLLEDMGKYMVLFDYRCFAIHLTTVFHL